MKVDEERPPNRELYALLHISPKAHDEEIRKAYRQWAQVLVSVGALEDSAIRAIWSLGEMFYYLEYVTCVAFKMKDIATENSQRIGKAYEILSDPHKRQIYDIYGMEGLTSGLELGPKLNKVEEIKEELERLRCKKQQEKVFFSFLTFWYNTGEFVVATPSTRQRPHERNGYGK